MTDEELIKRLRASRAVWEDGKSRPTDDETAAADRIEALTARLAKVVEAARAYRVATKHLGPCPETSAGLDAALAEAKGKL